MQSAPLDGLIVVSSPQDLAVMVVRKALRMAETMKMRVLGLVENISGAICPQCGHNFALFGESRGRNVAENASIPFIGALPLDPGSARLCDAGRIGEFQGEFVSSLAGAVADMICAKR